ncbi:MAG: MATE family efflux transporter, partial [Lachnospiraceae bacterium]|nr:MATE family efflux transporter [Lachnospiraceae bacterium]
VITAVILGMVFVLLADPMMRWCGSEPQTHDSAVLYFRIIMGGMIFNCVQMGINSAQRGSGNTRITMVTNVTSNTVNIIFNYLLINGHFGFPAWGVMGAAIATVLGTVVSSVMSVVSVMKPDIFVSIPYILKERIRPAGQALRQMILIGYGVFLEQILMRVGFLMTALMAARQGTDAMAAHQVGMNIMGLSFSFGDGLQAASVALIGRSLGQGKRDLAKAFATTCRRMGTVISVTLAILYYFGAELLMRMFFREEHIVVIGIGVMRVIIFVVLFQIHQVIYMGCLRGAGDTTYTAIASAVSVTVVRTGVSYLGGYVLGLGIVGIWLGILADQIARYLFSSLRFRQGKWVDIHI